MGLFKHKVLLGGGGVVVKKLRIIFKSVAKLLFNIDCWKGKYCFVA